MPTAHTPLLLGGWGGGSLEVGGGGFVLFCFDHVPVCCIMEVGDGLKRGGRL